MRRAKHRYVAAESVPHTGRGRSGHRAGNVIIWVAAVGLLLFVLWYWELAVTFWR
jgi:hypothetical protein